MRRRSNSGWDSADYSRRRGFSGSTVAAGAAVGFAGGIVLGTMINRPGGHAYYYHQQGWFDNNHQWHASGYYGSTGYHYGSASDIGYCPPNGAPDYHRNCGSSRAGWGTYLLLGCVGCCICFCLGSIVKQYCFDSGENRGSWSGGPDRRDSDMEMAPYQGDPITREGQPVPRGDALAFLQAAEAEYVDGVDGEVGNMYDRRSFLPEVQERLECEENAIRDSYNKQQALRQLAERWGMVNALNHS